MKLYTFWRSQAAFRVRIALNLKGLTREDTAINLDRGDQFKPEYKAQNPQAVVPTLYDGDARLFQSVAILEYLEEKYPDPPILPKDFGGVGNLPYKPYAAEILAGPAPFPERGELTKAWSFMGKTYTPT